MVCDKIDKRQRGRLCKSRNERFHRTEGLFEGVEWICLLCRMVGSPKYSIIVPVYNRPGELAELLESLTHQTYTSFEVLVIEDGSTVSSQSVFEKYADRLRASYFVKPNTGPGPSRNFGFQRARGDYFVVFDSDCVIPPHYLEVVDNFLKATPLDAWGGPDRGHEQFTPLQQAMAFTMSSVLTTGGIRGGKTSMGTFQPRSFNMGLSREAFLQTGGFHFDRYAEDIELSIRLRKSGLRTGLIQEAYVYHKRRTSFGQFFRQVSNFGKGRILVGRAHPGAVKITHWFPALFLLGVIVSLLLLLLGMMLGKIGVIFYVAYFLALFVVAIAQTRSVTVALLAIPAACIQLFGYGWGFLKEKAKTYMS